MVDLRWAPPSCGRRSGLGGAARGDRGRRRAGRDLRGRGPRATSGTPCGRIRRPTRPSCGTGASSSPSPGSRPCPASGRRHRVGCWGGVRPCHRRRGIGTQVFDWSLRAASEMASEVRPGAAHPVETDAARAASRPRRPWPRSGASMPVRRFLELARPTDEPVPAVPAADWPRAGAMERRPGRGSAPGPHRGLRRPLGKRTPHRGGVGAVVHGPPQLPARPLGACRRPCQRPGGVPGAVVGLPPGLGPRPGGGVDQHRGHPSARGGAGAWPAGSWPTCSAHRRGRHRLRAHHPRRRLREPHRCARACTAISVRRGRPRSVTTLSRPPLH